jgi:hypothetical protein
MQSNAQESYSSALASKMDEYVLVNLAGGHVGYEVPFCMGVGSSRRSDPALVLVQSSTLIANVLI